MNPQDKQYHQIEGILSNFKQGATYSDSIEKIQSLLASVRAEERKAYGGCIKCYGKGYSTVLNQMVGAEDFGGDGFVEKPKVRLNYCSCERGIALLDLLSPSTERGREDK